MFTNFRKLVLDVSMTHLFFSFTHTNLVTLTKYIIFFLVWKGEEDGEASRFCPFLISHEMLSITCPLKFLGQGSRKRKRRGRVGVKKKLETKGMNLLLRQKVTCKRMI